MKTTKAQFATLAVALLTYAVTLMAPSNAQEYIWLEAEEGLISSPMTIGADAEASGGQYVYAGSSEEGAGEYTFSVEGGHYLIWALAAATEPGPSSHNSFYVSLNGGAEDIWDLFEDAPGAAPYTSWTYDPISLRCDGNWESHGCDPWLLNLTAGQHTLTFRSRENLSRLDKILITSDLSFNPQNPPPPTTGSVTIGWDSPTTNEDGTLLTDLGGFKLHYGTSSGQYNLSIDVGLQTLTTVTDLVPLKPYHLAVTAYDHSGRESDYSEELVWAYDDVDADGMSDTWEIDQFGSKDSTSGQGNADADGDGFSNHEEFIAGTDPMSGTSHLGMQVSFTQGGMEVLPFVPAISGAGYAGYERFFTIEKCDQLTIGLWNPVPGFEGLQATGQTSTLIDQELTARVFAYRVLVWLEESP